jgi:hypothetical protein
MELKILVHKIHGGKKAVVNDHNLKVYSIQNSRSLASVTKIVSVWLGVTPYSLIDMYRNYQNRVTMEDKICIKISVNC